MSQYGLIYKRIIGKRGIEMEIKVMLDKIGGGESAENGFGSTGK